MIAEMSDGAYELSYYDWIDGAQNYNTVFTYNINELPIHLIIEYINN